MSMHEEVRRGRMRFVALNAVIWLALVIGGGIGIIGLRAYGNSMLREAELRADIVQAADEISNGEANIAQQNVLRVLQQDEHMLGTAMDILGADIAVMPRLANYIESRAAQPKALAPETRAHALLTIGRQQEAEDALAEVDDNDSDAQLWKARTALQRGDITKAHEAFNAHWEARTRERSELAETIASSDEAYAPSDKKRVADAMYRMIWSGLWEECLEAAHALGGAEAHPQFALALALEHDLNGESEKAKAAYQRVLQAIPTHRLATQRMERIKK